MVLAISGIGSVYTIRFFISVRDTIHCKTFRDICLSEALHPLSLKRYQRVLFQVFDQLGTVIESVLVLNGIEVVCHELIQITDEFRIVPSTFYLLYDEFIQFDVGYSWNGSTGGGDDLQP